MMSMLTHAIHELRSTRPTFRLPLSTHLANIAAILTVFGLGRIAWTRQLFTAVANLVPLGFYAEMFSPGYFKALSPLNWVFHMMTMIPNLEIIAGFLALARLYQQKSDSATGSYLAKMAGFYMIAHVHGTTTMLSHSMIDYDSQAEGVLMNLDYFFIRIQVMGLWAVMWIGWWTMIPISILVAQDILLFENIYGQILATLTICAVLPHPALPWGFKLGWTNLAIMHAIFPDASNDSGHLLGAIMLDMPLYLMCFSLNQQVKALEKQQS